MYLIRYMNSDGYYTYGVDDNKEITHNKVLNINKRIRYSRDKRK